MNIFALSSCPIEAAVMQCDKHIVKMPLESAQMLSTAHRFLDGKEYVGVSASGRKMKEWRHPEENWDRDLYKVVHLNHPCTLWTMESHENYLWHYRHFVALCQEFGFRYGKDHASFTKLGTILSCLPRNIPLREQTPFRLAMGAAPECINEHDPIGSYRAFYQTKQSRFKMTWKNRQVPDWFVPTFDHA